MDQVSQSSYSVDGGNRFRRSSLFSDSGWLVVILVVSFSLAGSDAQWGVAVRAIRWLVLIAIILDVALRRGLRKFRSCDVFFVIALTLALMSSIWSIKSNVTIARTISVGLLYLAIYFALWDRVSKWRLNKLYDLILVPGTILFTCSVLGGLLLPSATIEANRLKGVFENANTLGLFASFCFPIAVRRCILRPSNYSYGSAILTLLTVFMTGCRTAFLNIIVTFAMVILRLDFKRKWTVISILGVISAIYVAIMFNEFMESTVRLETLRTGSDRTTFWKEYVGFIGNRPLLGHGFGTEASVNDHYGLDWRFEYNIRGDMALNSYLGIASEVGLVGLGVFVLPLLAVVWQSIFVSSNKEIIFSSASVVAGLTTAIFESYLFSAGNPYCYIFWLHVMLVVHYSVSSAEGNTPGRWRRNRRKPKPVPPAA